MEGLPNKYRQFLAQYIHSIGKLEILLLLFSHSSQEWSAEKVSAELRLAPASTAAQLKDLADKNLLIQSPSGESTYRFNMNSRDLLAIVTEIATLYKERRTSVIESLYSQSNDHIRNFADAFVFRKDK